MPSLSHWLSSRDDFDDNTDILLDLRLVVEEEPMGREQWRAVQRAQLWLHAHPQEDYPSSGFIRGYLDDHYPWWKDQIYSGIREAARNTGSFIGTLYPQMLAAMGAGAQAVIQQVLQNVSMGMAQSFVSHWIITPSSQPPDLSSTKFSGVANGKRVRKGKVRAPKPWATFTKPPGSGRRRNFGR